MFADLLINGAVQASMLVTLAFLLSRFARDIVGRSLLAFMLCGAALTYIWFAARAGEGAYWVIGETVGVVIYGTMGLLALRGSPLWLAAGWAAHPIWDLALHYFGPGAAFAPVEYAITCLSFDLVVAAYVCGGLQVQARGASPNRRPSGSKQFLGHQRAPSRTPAR